MKRILLLLTTCFILISINGQTLNVDNNSAKQVLSEIKVITLIVDKSDFNSKPPVNFFYGEVARYLETLGYSVKTKYEEENYPTCEWASGYFNFSFKPHLTGWGDWKYEFTNVEFIFKKSCPKDSKEFILNLGNLIVYTSYDSMFKKLKQISFLN